METMVREKLLLINNRTREWQFRYHQKINEIISYKKPSSTKRLLNEENGLTLCKSIYIKINRKLIENLFDKKKTINEKKNLP